MSYREKVSATVTRITGRNPALAAWPVNSVFIGYTSANPATMLGGGTWTQISQGRMLVGQNPSDPDFDTLGDTGGAKTKTLGVNDLPPHAHGIGHDHGNATKSVQWATNTTQGGTSIRVTDIGGLTGGGGSSGTLNINVPAYSGNSFNQATSNDPINLMSPFLTVYIWRRIA